MLLLKKNYYCIPQILTALEVWIFQAKGLYGKVLCSSVNKLQQISNASSKEEELLYSTNINCFGSLDFPRVYGKVLCSSVNELQQISNASSKEELLLCCTNIKCFESLDYYT